MARLLLELDNVTNLPDGGPTRFEIRGSRSVDIGRDTYLDWTLPDASRVISGRHCEIRYRDGGYYVTDTSKNGTYLNGSDKRLSEPTRLKSGDTIDIGPYIIRVSVEGEGAAAATDAPANTPHGRGVPAASLWDVPDAAPPAPVTPERRGPRGEPVLGDALDWQMDLPRVEPRESAPVPPSQPPGWHAGGAAPDPSAGTAWDDAPAEPPAPAWEDVPAAPGPGRPTPRAGAYARLGGEEPGDPWSAPPPEAPTAGPPSAPPREVAAVPDAAAASPEPDGPAPAPRQSPPPSTAAAGAGEPDGVTSPRGRGEAADPDPSPAEAHDMPREPGRDQPFPTRTGSIPPPVRLHTPSAPRTGPDPAAPAEPAPLGPSAPPSADPGTSADYEAFLARLSAGLGVPAELLRAQGPDAVADRIGRFMSLSVGGLHALLKARATSRGFMRSGSGTTVEAVGNNPLKFLPTPEDVLRILLGPPTRSYLSMEETLDRTFEDVSTHQLATYTAMQEALQRLIDDLGPEAIERSQGEDGSGSFGRIVSGGRKAKLWDTYKERWTARAEPYDNGMVDVFMMHFGEAYGRALQKTR